VLRFGQYVRVTDPGLHFKLPFGIDRVDPVKVDRIQTLTFGFRSSGSERAAGRRQVPDESLMLTGDQNVVDVEWIVQYKIKSAPNDIVDRMPDGSHRLRFSPVAPHVTADAMNALVEGYARAVEAGDVDDLILIPAFVLDFLCIHPFRDGNGRLSRLLNLMLLYQSGYNVGRFVSLEKLIEESKESYYDALEQSSYDWHEGEHDLRPWLDYSLGILLAAYREFEERVGKMRTGRGAKREMVIDCIHGMPREFRYADVERACPGVSRPTIVRVFGELRDAGEIRCTKLGRDATWERLT
jgi:hypothetical protein